MKYLLIMNPKSKNGKSGKKFNRIFDLLQANAIDFAYEISSDPIEITSIARQGNKDQFDVIVAVGGDGTINAVINGFYDNGGKRLSNSKMGVIYTGTSPDFCSSYNITTDLDAAFKSIVQNTSRKIRIGMVSSPSSGDQYGNEYFSINYFGCCANIGLGAKLARRANGGIRKYLGDKAGTFIALIYSLIKDNTYDLLLHYDGKAHRLSKVTNISVGITEYIASGIRINHQNPNGSFYVMIVKDMKARYLTGLIRSVYSGNIPDHLSYLTLDHTAKIEISGKNAAAEIEYDGDPHGKIPCTISLADDPLDIIVAGL